MINRIICMLSLCVTCLFLYIYILNILTKIKDYIEFTVIYFYIWIVNQISLVYYNKKKVNNTVAI
jgi:hypothetical protein